MLKYRLGFLCARNCDTPSSSNENWASIKLAWNQHEIGGFTLWTDPGLPIVRQSSGSLEILVLGDVYDMDQRPTSVTIAELLRTADWSVLDRLGGRFAVLLITADRCRVAHDAFGARSVFYLADGRFAFASHAALLARAYGVGRSKLIAKFMQRGEYRKRSVKYLPGDMTVYEQMYALVPNNYLDSEDSRTHRYWPVTSKRETSLEEFHAEVAHYFAAFAPFVSSRYVPIFGITGGVDSRAVYCGFRQHNVSFRGVTWGAGYITPSEKPVVEEIVTRLGISHTYLDPREYPSDRVGAAAGCNSGNFRGASSLTEAMWIQYGELTSAAFVRGYGGEIVRGFYNLRAKRMSDLQAESLMNAYGSSIRGASPTKDYKISCAAIFDAYRERANYEDLESLGYDPSDIFYWEHRMGMWGSAMLNEMDPAVYSLVGFNSRRLFSAAFGLPERQRLTKELLKDVVSRNDRVLGTIPYC